MKVELDDLTLRQIAADGIDLLDVSMIGYRGWKQAIQTLGLWPAVQRAMEECRKAKAEKVRAA